MLINQPRKSTHANLWQSEITWFTFQYQREMKLYFTGSNKLTSNLWRILLYNSRFDLLLPPILSVRVSSHNKGRFQLLFGTIFPEHITVSRFWGLDFGAPFWSHLINIINLKSVLKKSLEDFWKKYQKGKPKKLKKISIELFTTKSPLKKPLNDHGKQKWLKGVA